MKTSGEGGLQSGMQIQNNPKHANTTVTQEKTVLAWTEFLCAMNL